MLRLGWSSFRHGKSLAARVASVDLEGWREGEMPPGKNGRSGWDAKPTPCGPVVTKGLRGGCGKSPFGDVIFQAMEDTRCLVAVPSAFSAPLE